MHGRLKIKTSKEQEEEQKQKRKQTSVHFRHLTQRLLRLRPQVNSIDDHEDFFKLSTEILLMNSDFYTVWNIRREALTAHVDKLKSSVPVNADHAEQPENQDLNDDITNKIMDVWKDELSFTNDCLKKNQKSYSVWQHRIWILSKMPKSAYEKEIMICNSLLAKDERNFHCWDYRSYISDVVADRDLEKEFEFTTEKIRSNFSNFSAWHRRHKLLLRGLAMPVDKCPKSCDLRLIWISEYELILNALFTDPSDQSPWLYHNWLVRNSFGNFGDKQLANLKTLRELEPDNKWLKQALELSTQYLNTVAASNC